MKCELRTHTKTDKHVGYYLDRAEIIASWLKDIQNNQESVADSVIQATETVEFENGLRTGVL